MNQLILMNEEARSLLHCFKYWADTLIHIILVYLWLMIQSNLI